MPACAHGPRDPIRFKGRSIPPEPSDLPHRQAWFLGQWEPDWKAWEAQKAPTTTAQPATPAKPKRTRKPGKKTAKVNA